MRNKLLIVFILLLTYFVIRNMKLVLLNLMPEQWSAMSSFWKYLLLGSLLTGLIFCSTYFLFRRETFYRLGLDNSIWNGVSNAFLFALPMFIGFAILNHFQIDFSATILIRNLFNAGFCEELIFRSFLFGILFYQLRWGFAPAALLSGVLFGIGHLYQAENWDEKLTIFLFTTLANAGFCWFYLIWRKLWMPIFLHGFMDLAWDMFNVQANVTGNLAANVLRAFTLFLAIYFSIKKLKNDPSLSLKDKWWINKGVVN